MENVFAGTFTIADDGHFCWECRPFVVDFVVVVVVVVVCVVVVAVIVILLLLLLRL